MKKFILVLTAALLFSTNADARGPSRHHHQHHQVKHVVHHQPRRHSQTIVIREPAHHPYYTNHVYYSHNRHYGYDRNMAQAGTILLGAGFLALAVSSF